jgi:hypothetical protein
MDKIDVIKVDVEGAEVEAVEGALETIRKHRPNLVIEIFDSPEKILKLLPPEYSCKKVADAYYLFTPTHLLHDRVWGFSRRLDEAYT